MTNKVQVSCEATSILLAAENSIDAVKELYVACRAASPKLSLATIQRRVNFPSKGYTSDIFQGRRRLPKKYLEKLAALFKLNSMERAYLETLIDWDRAKSAVKRAELATVRDAFRKILASYMSPGNFYDGDQTSAFVARVFTAFSIFGHRPSLKDLVGYFGKQLAAQVQSSLQVLLDARKIRAVGNRFVLEPGTINLFNSSDHARSSVQDALNSIDSWYTKPDLALFHSFTIALSLESYQALLNTFRLQGIAEFSKANTDNPAVVANFNLQMYPTLPV